ncbi:tRNA methyltransferase 10 homolog A [Trichogramma pretiosum]|uniref:tRNA methyltransferase 10 homolog A n=1 Tax=Trichogramma pretiosum TaxID=7493 RepID=UPI0006C9564E|nr:tRNA methyltransferase 10 homolog A [Trichogramma pretiosum]
MVNNIEDCTPIIENTTNQDITVSIPCNDDNQQSQDVNKDVTLTKRQLKKIKKREQWLERKGEKRKKERAKAKERKAYAKANNIDLGPSRKQLKSCTMADSPCKLNVTIDCSFDELMISKDIGKLIKQTLRCYSLNRRAVAPVQFSLSNFQGLTLAEMSKHNGYENWDVKFHSQNYLDIFPKDKIVYLTSESDNVIEKLDHDNIYVIGGLVDHNSQKGLCHKLAVENGVKHGRLPLDHYLQMKARKVLTIDHVFEIILRVTEGKSWQEAFLQVLPERKNAKPVLENSQTVDSGTDESQKSQSDEEGKDMPTSEVEKS